MKMIRLVRPLIVLAALAVAVVVAACGSSTSTSTSGKDKGTPAEQAFLVAMVPHHESAVEMAKLARQRAMHPQVKQLANNIVTAQNTEIKQMNAIHMRLFGTKLEPDAEAATAMGMSMDEAGMSMDPEELRTATPFDRAFIDMMIPHHQGAIRMARAAGKETNDAETRKLQAGIIAAQTSEIAQMKRWRAAWYGSAGSTMNGSSTSHGPTNDSMGMGHSG